MSKKELTQNIAFVVFIFLCALGACLFIYFDNESRRAAETQQHEEIRSQRHTVEGRIENVHYGDWAQLIIRFENGRLLKLRHGLGYGEMINIPFHTDVVVAYDGRGTFVKVTKVVDMEKWSTKIKLE